MKEWKPFEKKQNDPKSSFQMGRGEGVAGAGGGGGWGHGISRVIEERVCENSRGQLAISQL